MQVENFATVLPDVDHPAADRLLADDADAPVIERIPFAMSITLLEHRQFFIEMDVPIHLPTGKQELRKLAIGPLARLDMGKILTPSAA